MRLLRNRKGLSPVVATIILCGAVLTIGISTWSLAYTITSGLKSDYYESVKEQMDTISERFFVEHVYYSSTSGKLEVWVYNFAEVDIQVDVYVRGDAVGSNSTGVSVNHMDKTMILVSVNATSGNELSITVMSRRQNTAYATYIVPYS